ncbi:MAG TPA: TonB-dependent receptor [Candidatus Kryptonia bacterium]
MNLASYRKIIGSVCAISMIMTLIAASANAQSRSKIQGTVKDAKTGEPLIGVNVLVVGTTLGAVTDIDGNYFIVNVPVGTYDVRASMVGYSPTLVKDVIVAIERVATVNFSIESAEIRTGEVVVMAQRNEMHKEVSSTQMIATSQDIQTVAGIREINAFLAKLPGVSTDANGFLTIRSGTADQVGTLLNGLSYNNAAVGNSETTVPLSAIEQVSVLSGGYNAEYGNFRSGLINITTKSGTTSGYHGTITLSSDQSHMRRFGQSLYDPHNPVLEPYLDPSVAFIGTDSAWANDPYDRQRHTSFTGWIAQANTFNQGKSLASQATPLELYLLTSWMTMSVPDYAGLEKEMTSNPAIMGVMTRTQADSLINATRKAIAQHANKETGNDYDLDAGFGGPLPFFSHALGDATFYVSNSTTHLNYIEPVTLNSDFSSTSLITIKSNMSNDMTLTLNGLWKREIGVSPIRPANGDAPDISDRGGLMQQNNLKYVQDNTGIIGDNFNYLYDQAYFPILDQTTLVLGATFNHLISKTTYYELTFNRLQISDYTPTGDNRNTSLVLELGPFNLDESPYGKLQWAGSHQVYSPTDTFRFPSYDDPPGITNLRFRSKEGDLHDNSRTYQYQAKGDISSQIGEHNFVKGGFEYNEITLDHALYELWNNNSYNTYEFDYDEKPSQSALYLQDQVSYGGVVANLGLRFDYYYGGGGLWPGNDSAAAFSALLLPQDTTGLYSYLLTGNSQIWQIWEDSNRVHPGFLQPIKNFWALSPRLGVSFPITDRSKFYFNYGYFRSNPPYYSMYEIKYRYTKYGTYQMSNPNLEPPKTISYELGVEYNFLDNYLIRLSGYYKDVTGEEGDVNFKNSAATIQYSGFVNNQYEDTKGLEVELSKNDNSWINGWVNFNYALNKKGNAGLQNITDQPPVDADYYQANSSPAVPVPALNADITLRSPANWGPQPAGIDILGNWSMTVFGTWKAGDYFTWNPLGQYPQIPYYNLEWPDYYRVDLKLTRMISIAGITASVYLDVTNVLNLKINEMGTLNAFSSVLASSTYWNDNQSDEAHYLASLHLPMYNSPQFDALRQQYAAQGWYVPGNDRVGDLNSPSKPYIYSPSYADLFLYDQPRDIWFGIKVDF